MKSKIIFTVLYLVVLTSSHPAENRTRITERDLAMEAEQQPKKRTKVGITIATKKTIIAEHEAGVRVSELARQFGRSTSTISTIISQKERLKRVEVAKGVTLVTKQRSQGINDVEKELLVWLNDVERSSSGIPNETDIRCRARELYKGMAKGEKKPFKASRGWYENFRRRSGLFKNQTRKTRVEDDVHPTLIPALQLRSSYCLENSEGQLKSFIDKLSYPSAHKTRDVIPISAFYKSDDSDVDLDPGRNCEDARREGEQGGNILPCSREVDGTKEGQSVNGVPSAMVEKICGVWEEVRGFVEMCHPDQTLATRAIQTFDEGVMSYFKDVVRSRREQCCKKDGEFIGSEVQPVLEVEPKKSRRKNKPQKKLMYTFLSEDSNLM